jgi:hypothetical protein
MRFRHRDLQRFTNRQGLHTNFEFLLINITSFVGDISCFKPPNDQFMKKNGNYWDLKLR